jgi:NAD(P)-dependent dehydrogenase (short-subunit alcohol dehydrogenase family)
LRQRRARNQHLFDRRAASRHWRVGATKYAVNYLTEAMRQEVEDEDIRVTSVAPGVITTTIVRHFDPDVIQAIGSLAGMDIDVRSGERLPVEALQRAQSALQRFMPHPRTLPTPRTTPSASRFA